MNFTSWPGQSDPGPYPFSPNAPIEGDMFDLFDADLFGELLFQLIQFRFKRINPELLQSSRRSPAR